VEWVIFLSRCFAALAVAWGLHTLLSRRFGQAYNQLRSQLEWVITFTLLLSFFYATGWPYPEQGTSLSPTAPGLALALTLLAVLGAWWINKEKLK